MKKSTPILAKSDGTLLIQHLREVASAIEQIATHVDMDPVLARKGAHLHDIGKASPIFQQRLAGKEEPRRKTFRHEIASLFFLSLLSDRAEKEAVIHMVAAHHKSICSDIGEKGLLDLDDRDAKCFEYHSTDFEKWSVDALAILQELGWKTHPISLDEARQNYNDAIEYCMDLGYSCSKWKGLLMAADHLASGMEEHSMEALSKLFITPDLSFYAQRQSELYPLSLISAEENRLHTLVTAPTGAGKTDFLLRRCRGRVFYTLPFQASINAMYDRLKEDLKDTNAQIYPLHAASILKMGEKYERILSHHIGASIKVLTPHQIAAVAFGLKGYEATALDLKGCDVILDEIHTYTQVAQAMVLKIVEILLMLDCRIHIGTATMPTALYQKLLSLLGGAKNVYEVQLPEAALHTFNRHIIYKVDTLEDTEETLQNAIEQRQKILFVCNQVKKAQALFGQLRTTYPEVPGMLIHSRFKRKDRAALEKELREHYNTSPNACIVVSTQVVEVSLDISFDLMITDCAPIDALIQRFGRINRKRTAETIGSLKPIYVIAPPEKEDEAKPYDIEILRKSFEVLRNGETLQEKEIQGLLDTVYPNIPMQDIDCHSVFQNGVWTIKELVHYPKSALFDILEINSACCIVESDKEEYRNGNYSSRTMLEIPVSKAIRYKGLNYIEEGMHPYILPDGAYDSLFGYMEEQASPLLYKTFEIL